MKNSMRYSILGMILALYSATLGMALFVGYFCHLWLGIKHPMFYMVFGFASALIANLQLKLLTSWKT